MPLSAKIFPSYIVSSRRTRARLMLVEHVSKVFHVEDSSRSYRCGFANLICGSKEFRIIVYGYLSSNATCVRKIDFSKFSLCASNIMNASLRD